MFSNTLSDYTFNQSARFGNDQVDQSQRTLQNTKYLSSVLFQYTPLCGGFVAGFVGQTVCNDKRTKP